MGSDCSKWVSSEGRRWYGLVGEGGGDVFVRLPVVRLKHEPHRRGVEIIFVGGSGWLVD